MGYRAGNNLTSGEFNILIDNFGEAIESNTIRIGNSVRHSRAFIAGINGVTIASGVPVFIDANGQLGTLTSSIRFKENVEDIGSSSEAIYKLRPVSFVYKNDVANGDKTIQYGLIAEEAGATMPGLVVADKNNQPEAVRYHLLVPLLLNELQKEHRLHEEQNEKLQTLQKQIDELKQLIKSK